MNAEEWLYRGADEYEAGKYEEALTCFDKALDIQPDYYQAWNGRGVVLNDLGRNEEALTSFDKVLDIQPDYYQAWSNRGNALNDLGRNEEALTSFDKVLDIQPDYYQAWNGRGVVLNDLGRNEEALTSFDKVLDIQPDYYQAWSNRGNALNDLGRNEEALTCYEKALEIQPDYYYAWNNRGNALRGLGRNEEALTCYEKALEIQPDYYDAWNGRGNALRGLGRNEEAIASFDRCLQLTNNRFWKAWVNRGWAIYNSRGYKAALQNWNEGLQSLQSDTPKYQEGCGVLHQQKGNASYYEGKLQQNPYPYWRDAYRYYQQALKFLTTVNLRQLRLEVLQDTIQVCGALDETTEAEALLAEGTDLLGRLVQEMPSQEDKIRLSRKFSSFNQLRVDELAQAGNSCAALELAEHRKNLCLTWLYCRWSESVASPNYAQMQKLLQPSLLVSLSRTFQEDGQLNINLPQVRRQPVGAKAIIYWHISPAAITTFILRNNQPPLIVRGKDLTPQPPSLQGKGENEEEEKNEKMFSYSPLLAGEGLGERSSFHQLIEFEKWMEDWKKPENWQDEMPNRLKKIAEILNIPGILQHLKGVSQLILIPHRDLHLLPLHALFPNNFTITYLPSIKVGLDRKKPQLNTSLLSVENPEKLLYASSEADAVCKLYSNHHRLAKSAATKTAVKIALAQKFGIFHFTGHGTHNLEQPAQSALILANQERLTLKDILELDLSSYDLVCLSACQTNFTSKTGLIDEFIGLASGFVAAGSNNVIGSLWKVNDYSTAYLMTKFHQILQNSLTKNVPNALKEAQEWLRNATNEELKKFPIIEISQCRDVRISIAKAAENQSPDHKPFASPYHWAGFCAIGL